MPKVRTACIKRAASYLDLPDEDEWSDDMKVRL